MSAFTIAGVDVSRNKITVCLLDELPEDLKRFKSKWKRAEFKATSEGVRALLALPFHAAVLEPSGGHYSRLWAHHIASAGRTVRWVGHQEIAAYRESWKCFNKSDNADALALAAYGLERWNRPQFFITPSQAELRMFYQQLEHLNRVKNPVINRIRQQLSHELPEWSERDVHRDWLVANPPGLWRAIAGERVTPKYQKEIADSIGLGISEFTRNEAQLLCQLERQEHEIEQKLSEILSTPDYLPYMQVFEQFAIGNRTAAALLSAIYPMRQFLKDGFEIREHITTSNGKRARRNHSLSKFKLACGVGMVWYQSGNVSKWVPGGRSDVRQALWRWCKTSVVMKPNLELPMIVRLRNYYDHGSRQTIGGEEKYFDPGIRNQKVMRVVRRMLEMLYKELLTIG